MAKKKNLIKAALVRPECLLQIGTEPGSYTHVVYRITSVRRNVVYVRVMDTQFRLPNRTINVYFLYYKDRGPINEKVVEDVLRKVRQYLPHADAEVRIRWQRLSGEILRTMSVLNKKPIKAKNINQKK